MPKTSAEIGTAGEQEVVKNLKSQGYSITKWDTKAPGSTDIEATHNTSGAKLLVQVKSSVSPGTPSDLSSDELRNIKSRATKLGANAYHAKVTFGNDSLLSCNIEYSKL